MSLLIVDAQNVVHLCVGDSYNFGVPENSTSNYYWTISDQSLASINSGNGTHHILIDLNNAGVFQLFVEEIDANNCSGFDSIMIQIHNRPSPTISAAVPVPITKPSLSDIVAFITIVSPGLDPYLIISVDMP